MVARGRRTSDTSLDGGRRAASANSYAKRLRQPGHRRGDWTIKRQSVFRLASGRACLRNQPSGVKSRRRYRRHCWCCADEYKSEWGTGRLPPSPPAEKPAARQDQTWQHPRWNALHHAQTPAVLDHSSALAQGDGRARPAFAGCAEGSLATTSPTNSPAPFIRHCVAFPDFCEPWPPARQATYLNFIRSRHTLQNALALASYAAVCTANCNATTPVPRANRASTSAVPIA